MPYKDPDKAREHDRECYRRRTKERLAQGLCPKCGREPPFTEPPALLRSRPDVIRPQPRRASHHHAAQTSRLRTLA